MELLTALTTTGAFREFTPEPVADADLERVLDIARFAPSGGNRQGWRVIVVKDPLVRVGLRDLYLDGWYEYLAQRGAGLTPWSPTADRTAEAAAIGRAPEIAASVSPDGFAERLHEVPVLLAIVVDLGQLAAVDRDLDRYSFVGAASVYPFAWNLLLAARELNLGGVLTTMATRRETDANALLGVPVDHALAGLIALGHPVRTFSRLTRAAVSSFTTVDGFDGPAFGSALGSGAADPHPS